MKFREVVTVWLVILVSFSAYIYLFVFADRDVVFLTGQFSQDPFDSMTRGRYWMSGLVLGGMLTIIYLIIQGLFKGIIHSEIVSYKKVVGRALVPLNLGIVIIMMFFGDPAMTLPVALSAAFALSSGIFIGFSVADDLFANYRSTFIYLSTGLGLVPILVLFRVLELPQRGILATNEAMLIALGVVLFGVGWLLLFYRMFRNKRPAWTHVLKGTLAAGYLGLPLLHYITATPEGIPYITSSDNFFADNMALRVTTWGLLMMLAFLADKLTRQPSQPVIS